MSDDLIRGLTASGPDKGLYLSCAYCSRTWPAKTPAEQLAQHIAIKHPRRRRAS